MQRLEAYKESVTRGDLLRIGDEAVSEMEDTVQGQFTLTEMLMVDQVDRLITKRLGLQSFTKWRGRFLKVRAAQREPMHWGVDPGHPAARLLPRLEPGDAALVLGAAAEPVAYLLAAHDVAVTFVAGNLGAIDRVETRVAQETLGSRFQAFMVAAGGRIAPYVPPFDLAVVDASELLPLDPDARRAALEEIQDLTLPNGLNAVVPARGLAPQTLRAVYGSWEEQTDRTGGRGRRDGLIFSKPEIRFDTA